MQDSLARVSELPDILQHISSSMEEAQEDPFSSTFEALRVMQSTISKFTPESIKQVGYVMEPLINYIISIK